MMKTIEDQHLFVRKGLIGVATKCAKQGIDPKIMVETMLSVSVSVAVATCEREDVAHLLKSMAAFVRSGAFMREVA